MSELVGIAVVMVVLTVMAGAMLRVISADGYGHRAVRAGAPDPARDWSADLPTRPYSEL